MHYSDRQLKQAVTWFVQLQSESCSEQEKQAFSVWLAKDTTAHQAAYTKAEQLWGSFDNLKTLSDLPALNDARNSKARKSHFANVAYLLCAMLLGGVAYLEVSAETQTYTTKRGEHQHIVLADGSRLDLNTDTQLHVKLSLFQRQVLMEQGEALFTVQHESLRAFTVQASNLQIRDIGTRFNVHQKVDSVTVAVLEGEVTLNDGQTVYSLLAGKQRVYSKNKGLNSSETAVADNATAWLSGHLFFNRTPLQQVTAELERYHDVQFIFANPKLGQETLSGTFEAVNLEPFLHAIEPMLGVRAKRQGKQIFLQKK